MIPSTQLWFDWPKVDTQPKWNTQIYLLEVILEMENRDGRWSVGTSLGWEPVSSEDPGWLSYILWKWRQLTGKKTKKADVLERFLFF